jgi:ABC-2 type transport system permease protein
VSDATTVLLVAGREVRQRLRSRAFAVVTVLFALALVVVALLPTLLAGSSLVTVTEDRTDAPPTVVGVLGDDAAVAAVDPAVEEALDAALGTAPQLVAVPDEAAVAAALDDGEVAFVIEPDGGRVLAAGSSGPFGPVLSPSVPEALGLARALAETGVDPGVVGDLLAAPPAEVEVVTLGPGTEVEGAGARFAVAYLGSVLLYLFLIFFANLVVTGVIEEKGSRVVELLLPAAPARALMGGKVLGLGVLGAGQALVIITPAAVVLALTQGAQLPPRLFVAIAAIVVAFVLGFALYAGIAAGLSALVSRVEDSQVALLPLYAVLVIAFFVTFPVLGEPGGTLAQVVTFVPFTAPLVVPARIALVELPFWQAGLAAAGVIVTAVLLTLVAARLYEGSILRSGARVRLRSAWRGSRG